MKRKLFSLVLCFIMVLSLTGCGTKVKEAANGEDSSLLFLTP